VRNSVKAGKGNISMTVISKEDVDLIIQVMTSQDGGLDSIYGYVDRETGEVSIGTPDNPVEGVPAEDDDEVPAELHARFLKIPYVGSRDGYQDMVDFIETVEDERLRDLLGVAVKGKGAFGRFKDVLRCSEYKLEQEGWFAFGGQLETDRAIKWLASEGLSVST
jgi:Uncharacterised protein family (UPF0158)